MSNSISNSITNNDELENALEKAFENKLFSSNSLKRRNEFANLKNYLGKYLYSSNVLKILFNWDDISVCIFFISSVELICPVE